MQNPDPIPRLSVEAAGTITGLGLVVSGVLLVLVAWMARGEPGPLRYDGLLAGLLLLMAAAYMCFIPNNDGQDACGRGA